MRDYSRVPDLRLERGGERVSREGFSEKVSVKMKIE